MAHYILQIHGDAYREFVYFVNLDRSNTFNVGELFRMLEDIEENGLPDWLSPVYTENKYHLYMFSCGTLNMYVAENGQPLILIHLSDLGEEGDSLVPAAAINRMEEYLGV